MTTKNIALEEQLIAAISNESSLKFEMDNDNDKTVTISPRSAYDLDKEIIEIHGSVRITYLKGIKKRSMEKIWVKDNTIWVAKNKNFKVIKIGSSERIEEKINENPSLISKEDLETPPFFYKRS